MPAQYGCGPQHPAILPLTSDRPQIEAAIDTLDASGHLTYSALGVRWGQRLLDPQWRAVWGDPVHPVDPAEDTRKALVLLTDGEDTYCDMGSGRNPSCADSRVGVERAEACAAAKAAGIEIFVITAMVPALVSQELDRALHECSSESDDPDTTYVFVNNATTENIEAAFADIASQLQTVRRLY